MALKDFEERPAPVDGWLAMVNYTNRQHRPARVTIEGQRIALVASDCEFHFTSSEARAVIDDLKSAVARVDDRELWAEDEAVVERPGPWTGED